MLDFDGRHSRQERLPEVGVMGQQRISEAVFCLAPDRAGALAREYLQRAGARAVVEDPELPAPPFAHAECFRHIAARDIAEGAWRALRALRSVLEADDDPPKPSTRLEP